MIRGKDNSNPGDGKLRGWIHFGIAATILAVTAIGWGQAMRALQWATQKEAIPWPEGVMVDPDTQRWSNLPEQVGGRFVIAEDGELPWSDNGKLPDGEVILKDDTKHILGIGTTWDRNRLAERRSNWHVTRIYRDNRKPPGHPLRYWRLEVCFYTGRLDTVPHVPERCLKAGGAAVGGSGNVTFAVPAARSPWDKPLPFRRVDYEYFDDLGSARQHVMYYTFSLNGEPESSWEKVRLALTYPWVRHCYFAKIQFGPEGPVVDAKEYDIAAEDFMNYFLPIILHALPTPSDIEALKLSETPEE